jgi:hypothetical protein
MTDYNFGKLQEERLFNIIKKEFGEDLTPSKERYALFDFNSEKTSVELKSRRCNHNTYPDTMMNINKIYCANEHPDKTFIFCFNFEDGLYYFKHKKDYEYKVRFAGRRDRGVDERKTYAFIPVEDLTKVQTSF